MRFRAIFPALLAIALPLWAVDGFRLGELSPVAGGGMGEGGPGLEASLLPQDVLAGAGVLYIADEQFNRVRAVDPGGRIRTVVGSGYFGFDGEGRPALESGLAVPAALALGPGGRLYLVDLGNRRVRVVAADGTLNTVVDAHSPIFAGLQTFAPAALAVDAAGRVLVADRGNHVVWQIDADGRGRRAAGDGHRGFGGDGGPAALAQLADPRAVALGPDGAIYIADLGNRRVRRVDAQGEIHTVAGDGGEEFWEQSRAALEASIKPVDLELDAQGRLLIVDELQQRLLRLESDGDLHVLHTFGAEARPRALSVDAAGRVLVADYGRREVVAIDAEGRVERVAGNGRARASGDGGPALNASLYEPLALVFDAKGDLYIADHRNDLVRRVRGDGLIETVAGNGRAGFGGDGGPALEASLRGPAGLAFDAEGNLYIADAGNGRIRRLGPEGRIQTVAGDGGVAFLGDGAPPLEAGLQWPVDVGVDRAGRLYIADAGAHRVYRIGGDGLLRVVAGTGEAGRGQDGALAVWAALDRPLGLALDGAGGVYIADSGNGRLLHVDGDGVLRVLKENLGGLARLARAADGALLLADIRRHRIARLPVERLWPEPSARIRTAAPYQVESGAALPLPGLLELVFEPRTGRLYATHGRGIERVLSTGEHRRFADFEARLYRTVAVSAFPQDGLLLGTPRLLGRSAPLTLMAPQGTGVLPLRLEYFFAGADALAQGAGGELFIHQSSGRVLRLRRVGEPLEEYLELPPGEALLERGPGGVLFIGMKSTGVLLKAQDLNADGVVAGAAELERLAVVQGRPVGLAYGDALYIATAAGTIERLEGEGPLENLARGFAPALLDLAYAGGVLYALEGDAGGGRIVRLAPPAPLPGVWPSLLDFGPLVLGSSAVRPLLLRNDGTRVLHLFGEERPAIEVEGGGELRLEPGEVRRVKVRFAPPNPGAAADTLVWRNAAGAGVLRLPLAAQVLAPALEVGRESIDFGVVAVGARSQDRLMLRNGGEAPLRLEGVEVDSPFVGALREGLVLEAGEELALPLAVRPLQRRVYEAVLILRSSDPEAPLRRVALRVRGGQAQLGALPAVEELGAVRLGEQGRRRLVLRNEGEVELRIDSVLTGTRRLIATPRRLRLAPGETGSLALSFAPLEYGRLEGELRFVTNDPAQPRVVLPFAGRGFSALLEVEAESHTFAPTPLGRGRVWELELRNLHRRPVVFRGARTSSTQFRVLQVPERLEPEARGVVQVEYRPTRLGPVRARLSLFTDLEETSRIDLELEGRAQVDTRVELEPPQTRALWPGGAVRVPLRLRRARRLSGLVLELKLSGGALAVEGMDFPPGSLLEGGEKPLIIHQEGDSGRVELGISLTGRRALRGLSGAGLLGLLRLRLGEELPATPALALERAVFRSALGTVDTLPQAAALELDLRLKGDFDGNGRLEMDDFFLLMDRVGQAEAGAVFDLDGDGKVDRADVRVLADFLAPAAASKALVLARRPRELVLRPAYPNPFNAQTVLVYELARAGEIELAVYNILGQKVRTLAAQRRPAGVHRVVWDGRDDGGRSLGTGVYLVALESAGQRRYQRLLLLR